jgi:hypothetical protein
MKRTRASVSLEKLLIGVLTGALLIYAVWWRPRVSRAELCRLQIRNYQTAINSCGVDRSCHQAWKDPEETEKLVSRLFSEKIPLCPSGGTCSLVHGVGPNPDIPTVVCSRPECLSDQDVFRETMRKFYLGIRARLAP